jgi:hypothetical protein
MFILSDIFLVVLLMKFLWETVSSKLMPWSLFVISTIGLPFLLGLGGRAGQGGIANISVNAVLRGGVAIAGLLIFLSTSTAHVGYGSYLFMVGMGLILYMMGRFARRMFKLIIIAVLVVIAIITYLLVRPYH